MLKAKQNILFIFSIFVLLCCILIGRLFYLQLIKYDFFQKRSMEQRLKIVLLSPDRGDIFDRNGSLLATTIDSYSIFAIPPNVVEKKTAASLLSRMLELDRRRTYKKLASKRPFIWIKRKVDSRLKERIKKLELAGIGILKERKRIYPKGRIASQVLGFVGIDNQGLAGIELKYDDYLKGRSGRLITEKDVRGRDIMTSRLREIQAPSDGMSLTLTIDEPIQYVAEREIKKMVKTSRAKAGTVIVMNIKSGELLALATYPDFDPNEYFKFRENIWYNRAVTDVYEPGSTFKLVTIASAIQEKAITPNSHIYCPDFIKIGKRTIRNSHRIEFEKGRYVLPAEILNQSINTGAANIGIKLGKKKLYEGIRKFGFGQFSGIDLPGESRGILRRDDEWVEVDVATISFGQGVAVTPIQLIVGLSSIANGGERLKPRVVKKIVGPGGSYIKIFTPERAGSSVSHQVAKEMLKMAESVVTEGTGKPAGIKNFRVGGKTGTSQKVKPGGGYYTDSFVSSFIGFAPLSDPEISVLVVVDDPKTEFWGEKVAAPVFKSVTEFTLRRLNLSPDNVKTSML